MKKAIIIFCLLVFIVEFAQIIYFKRGAFVEKYDVGYWKDRFEHSQWELPASRRSIGDDGLYAYVGYLLINGLDPSTINAQVPPVAEYLIGLSIILFRNPIYYTFIIGIVDIILVYFISKKIFRYKFNSWICTSLFFLDPIFFSQFTQTLLDTTQLFFLLLNCFFLLSLFKEDKQRNKILALFGGLCLGFFTETKFPILFPLIFLLETIYFFVKDKIREYPIFIIGIVTGIIVSSARYFLLGHNLIDFFKFQKYIVTFYLNSRLQTHIGAIMQYIFTGNFPDIVSGKPMAISEWSLILPFIVTIGIISSIICLFSKKTEVFWKGISFFVIGTLLIFSFITFYPRYMIIILPFLYLLFIKFFEQIIFFRKSVIIFVVMILFAFINARQYLMPSYKFLLENFYYNLSNQYFQDIYEEDINTINLSRDKFRFISQTMFQQAGIKTVEIYNEKIVVPKFGNNGYVSFTMVYKTQDLGAFSEKKTIQLVKINNQWKLKWNWDIILNKFLPDYHIETNMVLGKRGSIIDSKGIYLAKDAEGYLLSVNPEKISLKREQFMLETFSRFGNVQGVGFQNAYLENALPDTYVPILTLDQDIFQKEKDKLLSYPGVMLNPYSVRSFIKIDSKTISNTFYKECCTRIYSSYNYHGIKGLEKEFDKVLWGYSGGKILIKDNKGAIIKVVFAKDKKDGKDVILQ